MYEKQTYEFMLAFINIDLMPTLISKDNIMEIINPQCDCKYHGNKTLILKMIINNKASHFNMMEIINSHILI